MAPSSTGMVQAEANGQKAQNVRKLRKPAIEKMRRDRINSSIEQLRMLLEKELQKQQLPSKPEKADILEMTVTFLQQHLAGKTAPSSHQTHIEGYSRCIQDSEQFLSQQRHTEVQAKLLQNISWTHAVTEGRKSSEFSLYQSPNKHPSPETIKDIWRPW